MGDPIWRVVVHQDISRDEARALTNEGARYISGHSGPGYASSSILARGSDADSAADPIRRALGTDVLIGEIELLPIHIYAPIPDEARSAFEAAAGEEDRVGGVVEDESTGTLEVYFELEGGNVERAFREARGLYERISQIAGVEPPDPLEMWAGGFEALLELATRDRQLLERAKALAEQSELDLAVVVAQTACEILVADTLRSLAHPHTSDQLRPWLLERLKGGSLLDDQTRRLWNRLGDTDVSQEAFWGEYIRHVHRRNAIVHRGIRVTAQEAQASIEAAEALFEHVETTAGRAPPPTDE